MSTQTKQPTCADRVSAEWDSRRADLAAMFTPGECSDDELRSFLEDQGADDDDRRGFRHLLEEDCQEAQSEYGLAFDYVAPNTFPCQPEAYWRYQFSWGGPSDELRLYGNDGTLYRAEYWFLDWSDGASVTCTEDPAVNAVWEFFSEIGTLDSAREQATQ